MLYRVFGLECSKNYCHSCNQRPPICLITKFRARLRIIKFEQKMPYFGVSESNFEKLLAFL